MQFWGFLTGDDMCECLSMPKRENVFQILRKGPGVVHCCPFTVAGHITKGHVRNRLLSLVTYMPATELALVCFHSANAANQTYKA